MVRIHGPADKHHTWFQTETESPSTLLQGTARIPCSLPHHLHDHPLVPLPVKLRIENSLPCPQVELACRDRHDYLMVNQQRLQMRIPVVLARLMMFVVFAKRRQMLQPPVNILDQSALVVVNVNSSRDVHG